MEQIVPGSIVAVGKKERVRAVVCTIRPKRVEVVYLDASGKALHQEISGMPGPGNLLQVLRAGVPADKDMRLEQYVKMLRMQQ